MDSRGNTGAMPPAKRRAGSILLFRPNAMRAQWSPVQLHEPLRITGRMSWIFLCGLGLGVLSALVWGVFGTVPTRVAGQGQLVVLARETQSISAFYAGDLRELLVRPGDNVKMGDVIARLDQHELIQQRDAAERALALLVTQRENVVGFYKSLVTRHADATRAQRANLSATIELLERSTSSQSETQGNMSALAARGLVTRLQVEEVAQRRDATEVQLQQSRAQLQQTDIDELNIVNQRDASLREYDSRIADATEQLAQLKISVELSTVVHAPVSGRIVTVDAEEHTRVSAGATIATMAAAGDDLEAIVFVSAQEQPSIRNGMRVDVVPLNVRAEEFGAIVGVVSEVGAASETKASMMRLLNNDIIVSQMASMGTPLLLRVQLVRDASTPTGFRWSSGRGPSRREAGELAFGTLVSAQVTVRERPPISTVLPALKRWFGLHP